MKKVYQYLKVQLFYLATNKKGLSLTGVLVTGAVGAIVTAGTLQTMSVSLQSAQVVRSSLTESDLRFVLGQTLSTLDKCKANFKPTSATIPPDPEQDASKGLYGQNREHARGELVRFETTASNADHYLKKGVNFKGDLKIVKMKLSGDSTTVSTNDPKQQKVSRDFTVFYKKVGMGSHSTRGGQDCSATTLKGCYFTQCTVQIQFENKASPKVTNCSSSNCATHGSGGTVAGGVDCYKVDKNTAEGGKTLVGCGNTETAKGVKTTAIGFKAGKSVQTGGTDNTFIGAHAGEKTTTGDNNLFVGKEAGLVNTTAGENTFVGSQAGMANTTGWYNTFVGHLAGNKSTTGNANTFIGQGAGRNITAGTYNSFIGVNAGMRITAGTYNTFIGKEAGQHQTAGAYNTFIGSNAGQHQTGGEYNIAIGWDARLENPTGSSQINIGNRIKSTGHYIKICNSSGNDCVEISTTGLNCPPGQYFKGLKFEGSGSTRKLVPDCGSGCPTSHNHFWGSPDNKCHKCPRASPLHRPGHHPVCQSCPLNSLPYNLSNNSCPCPSSRPHLYDGKCNKCREDRYEYDHPQRTGSCHYCPQNKPYKDWDCQVCPSQYPYASVYGTRYHASGSMICTCGYDYKRSTENSWECVPRCPLKSYWDGSKCQLRCDSNAGKGWHYRLKRCVTCSSHGKTAYLGVCICECGYEYNREQDRCSPNRVCQAGRCWGQTSRTCKPGCDPRTQSWHSVREVCVPKEVWPQDSL